MFKKLKRHLVAHKNPYSAALVIIILVAGFFILKNLGVPQMAGKLTGAITSPSKYTAVPLQKDSQLPPKVKFTNLSGSLTQSLRRDFENTLFSFELSSPMGLPPTPVSRFAFNIKCKCSPNNYKLYRDNTLLATSKFFPTFDLSTLTLQPGQAAKFTLKAFFPKDLSLGTQLTVSLNAGGISTNQALTGLSLPVTKMFVISN